MRLFTAKPERESYGVHKMLRTGEVSTSSTSIIPEVADGLFCLLWVSAFRTNYS